MRQRDDRKIGHGAQAARTLNGLAGGIVVAIESRGHPSLRDPGFLVPMAQLVEQGGARAILVDSLEAFAHTSRSVDIPVIVADLNPDAASRVAYTPSVERGAAAVEAGATIVMVSANAHRRPGGDDLASIVETIHAGGALAFGLIDVAADLHRAFDAGVDAVGLWQPEGGGHPETGLLAWLVRHSAVPVFCGGGQWTPPDAREALGAGASFVIIGEAIANPAAITSRYVRGARSGT